MFQDDLESATKLLKVLCIFEHLSGLKINFLKSEVFCCEKTKERSVEYTLIFTYDRGLRLVD